MANPQIESLIKIAALVLDGLGVALILAFIVSRLPRLLGAEAAKLDNKYFVVDFSGLLLWIGISCVVVGVSMWLGRSVLARLF